MDGANLVHGNLSLLVTGAYEPPLLFGHLRKMMNHAHGYPTHSAFSRGPLIHTLCSVTRSVFTAFHIMNPCSCAMRSSKDEGNICPGKKEMDIISHIILTA